MCVGEIKSVWKFIAGDSVEGVTKCLGVCIEQGVCSPESVEEEFFYCIVYFVFIVF